MTTTTVTVTINNQTITADMQTIAALLNIAAETSLEPKQTRAGKAEAKMQARAKRTAKVEAERAKHDALLDSKRVERMTQTAITGAAKQGFECKSRKQGKWMWLYPTNSTGRTPEFKAMKLAKGWKYSPKRGAFYRDFSELCK